MSVNNKMALITGAGGYLGGKTALRFSERGVKVAICDINEEAVKKTVDRITANGGCAKGYRIDVTSGLVEFMASDEEAFITGQTYIIDGGQSLAMKGTD